MRNILRVNPRHVKCIIRRSAVRKSFRLSVFFFIQYDTYQVPHIIHISTL